AAVLLRGLPLSDRRRADGGLPLAAGPLEPVAIGSAGADAEGALAIGSDHRWLAAAGRQRTRRPVGAVPRLRERCGARGGGDDLAEPVRGGHHPSPATAAGDWRRG